MHTNEKIRQLRARAEEQKQEILKMRVQLDEIAKAVANSSLVAMELVMTLSVLKKKGIITDVEIQEAYKAIKEAQGGNSDDDSENPKQPAVQSEDAGSVAGSG